VIKLVAAFSGLTALLSLGYNVWQQNQPYEITGYFASADQVVARNDVVMNGVPVGSVSSVAVAPDTSNAGAIIKMTIDRKYMPLQQGTKATIRPKGLLGVMYIELQPGSSGRPIARGGTIPLQDTAAPVTLDEINDIFDPQTRTYIHNLTIQGGIMFQGQGQNANALLQALPAISQDAADISAQLAAKDAQLDALAKEFDIVAGMWAAEAEAFKRDLANGADLLDVMAQHQAKLQQEIVYADSALAKLNGALSGHEQDLNAILKAMPGLLDSLRTFQNQSTTDLGILAPCSNDILSTLSEMKSAMNYRTPSGSNDGQGYELRTDSQIVRVGASTGSFNTNVPCTGGTP
jgi:phospholipid/cholesterol/gamma-HCH transport system substrate-binding protein